MARAEKRGKGPKRAPKATSHISKASSSDATAKIIETVRALGGDDADLSLVQKADGAEIQEFSDHEATDFTTKDVSKFLKTLDFASVAPSTKSSKTEVPSKPTKPLLSQKPEPKATKKDKKIAHDTASLTESQKSGKAKAPAKMDPPSKPIKPLKESKAAKSAKGPSAPAIVAAPDPSSSLVKKQLAEVKLNIPASSRWYATDLSLPPLPSPTPSIPATTLVTLRDRAASLHTALPPPPSHSHSDQTFLQNILSSGTLSDRLSALTLTAQSSPIHNTRALESLKTMASKKGREESLKALRAIVDWWVGGGAPDRKLKYFADQPLTHPDVTDTHLTYWYFEDWLKKYFFSILQLLETLSQDLLPYVRTQAMNLLFQLLDAKAEQEQNLLRLVVNKLGDSEKTVASKASYLLLQILQHHPGMKSVIIREVSELILRPPSASAKSALALSEATTTTSGAKKVVFGQSSSSKPNVNANAQPTRNYHARYYGVITLNQITLTTADKEKNVAGPLLDLYFKLFKEILNDTGHSPSAPAPTTESVPLRNKDGEIKRDKQGRVFDWKGKGSGAKDRTHKGDGDVFEDVEDVDSKTVSAILSGVNRAFPFAKTDDEMFNEHIDTLFRITHTATFNVSIQALMLILQVTSAKESISDRFYRTLYESIFDPRLVTSSKQALWLNLVFKAVKADKNHARVAAFVKRVLQALGMHQPPFICGTLYMIGQLVDQAPDIRQMMLTPEAQLVAKNAKNIQEGDTHSQAYDPRKRDPQWAHADNSCLWELIPLLNHFHPSVSLHASQLLSRSQVTATPDLALNTLSSFLDRFVYKNPKKPKPRGASAMQPAAHTSTTDGSGSIRMIRGLGDNGTVNDASFWNQKVEQVPVDQLFFHKFFSQKLDKQKERSKKVAKRKKGGADSDEDDEIAEDNQDVEDDEDVEAEDTDGEADEAVVDDEDEEEGSGSEDSQEDEIWQVMKRTMPGPKADLDLLDDDSDDIPSGLDDLSGGDAASDAAGSDAGEVDAEEGEEASDAPDGDADEDDESVFNVTDDEIDLIDLDADVPDSVPWTSAFEPEEGEVGAKRKSKPEDAVGGRKKRKLAQLPTFASYEDYAKLIEDGPEDDI